eukprot:scaffold209_cov396-Prasinococcus_capsulatus_cf.AAC.16
MKARAEGRFRAQCERLLKVPCVDTMPDRDAPFHKLCSCAIYQVGPVLPSQLLERLEGGGDNVASRKHTGACQGKRIAQVAVTHDKYATCLWKLAA